MWGQGVPGISCWDKVGRREAWASSAGDLYLIQLANHRLAFRVPIAPRMALSPPLLDRGSNGGCSWPRRNTEPLQKQSHPPRVNPQPRSRHHRARPVYHQDCLLRVRVNGCELPCTAVHPLRSTRISKSKPLHSCGAPVLLPHR